MTLVSGTELSFQIKPTMQKAGIVEFTLKRLEFIFKIVNAGNTLYEVAEFEPSESFEKNRDNILECLKEAFKFKELNESFTEQDLSNLRIELNATLAENSDTLCQIMKDNPYESGNNETKEIYTYKYSGSGVLYETVILEGKPVFI